MNRLGTALFAAVEAALAVAVGLGIALVPFALLWGVEYGLQLPWSDFWKGASDVWLVGHGVDVTFVLDAATAKATGLAGAGDPIVVSLAALGFAVVTAWIGARAGRRFAETDHRATGLVTSVLVVAVLSLVIALGASAPGARPSIWQAIVLPALWYGIPAVASAEVARRRRGAAPDPVTERVLDEVDRIPARWRIATGVALRGGVAVVAIVVAVAALLVAVALLFSYAEVITLYERSHAGVVGGLSMTVGELAFVPDFIAWAMSWIIGPGFAIGTGSSVSPIATVLGPIPAVPVFGALPANGHAFGFAWVLVPVVAGFLVAAFLRPRLVERLGAENTAAVRAVAGLGIGVVAGAVAGIVAALASGALGPGRLATVGPSVWPVAGLAALEVGVPAMLALAVGSDLVRIPSAAPAWMARRDVDVDAEPSRSPARAPIVQASTRTSSDPTAASPSAGADRPVFADTATTDDDGGFLGALDRASAGRTTDVHRFAPADHASRDDDRDARDGRGEYDADSDGDRTDRRAPASAGGPASEATEPIDDDDLVTARTTEARRPGERAARLQDVLRRAGREVRGQAERVRSLRASAPGSSTEDAPEQPAATGAQAGFPWRTEEFVDAASQDDASQDASTEDAATEDVSTGAVAADRPIRRSADRAGHGDRIRAEDRRDDERPWWTRPAAGTDRDED